MITHSPAEHTRALAAYLPNGKLFEAKNIRGSNLNQLLRGLAGELRTAEGYLRTLEAEYFPGGAVLFLDEWEQALGIPDSCFNGKGDADERRTHILVKLASLGIQTSQDFVDLAALFGVVVTVTSGSPDRFTISVTFTAVTPNVFPLTFPIPFGDPIISVLRCLYSKLKPANCNVIFAEV